MFSNTAKDSIFQDEIVSQENISSPQSIEMEPFSDFESNYHCTNFFQFNPIVSFNTKECLQFQDTEDPEMIYKIKEDDTSIQEEQNKRKQKIWNDEEDQRLRYLFVQCQGKWNEIAKHMPQRNASQCQQRWRRINPPKDTRHIWTQEEDNKLTQLVQDIGKQWMKIAKCFGNITGKQARDRYINKLDQSIKKQPWTYEEDMFILDQYIINGPRWTKISNHLNGRPVIQCFLFLQENHVKNRFYSFIKRKYLGEQNRYQIIYS
ncbi:unnamed protein product [Paramecium octaurelia]|uniref:Myb-like DNA-binding domain containing protein n=1 Tax=Paramecium octaurelia TaxID=43137 RepID=A0A8S1SFY1_PAROT|nr:unnamed protein product [Paramecium octaurelia]